MDKILRINLDKVVNDMLDITFDRYWRDSDDRDLFLDVVMQWLQNVFGIGEILEYISIGYSARKDETEAQKADSRNVAELLQRVIDYLPPHECNLFGEKAQPSEQKRYNELWDIYKTNKIAFLESVQDEIEQIKCGRDAKFLVDVMQIWIAKHYHIEEDLEVLKHRYGIKE